MKKKYFIDTSIILDNIENLNVLYDEENLLFISDIVLLELGKKKENLGESGYFSREFFRLINHNLGEEITIESIGLKTLKKGDFLWKTYLKDLDFMIPLYIISRSHYATPMPEWGQNDLKIAEIALDYGFTLITNDTALKIHSLSRGIQAESLERNSVHNVDSINFFHSFTCHIQEIPTIHQLQCFQELSDWSLIEITEEENTGNSRYLNGKKQFGFKIKGEFCPQNFDEILKIHNPYVLPLNLEQKMYYSLLIHPSNRISVVSGATGSGKTLIALQAGLTLLKMGMVDGIVYLRNTITANDKEAELGFRKGGESEKLDYFMYPLYSAINFMIAKMQKESLAKRIEYRGENKGEQKAEATEYFMKKHHISLIDIAHARGITIAKKFVIFDEVQNASNATVKLIGTRMGEESRIVFLGDTKQIDHPYLSRNRNGLATLLKMAKDDDYIAAIKLKQTIRSEIAGWFEDHFI
ncbi:phosphate starvation-inducible protein PhoH [Helicobacter monodelphidis]|uniref:PhoH family protein n=1 Tax=Helicobacter sp. 15-1451 TaxID=2004995 RepID=UPI000DCDA403|nr:PhoH family protein [Helicobacter sp. 15-1451]RAX57344.1 phosphate starvation-inducible protein PhoH [Helicobacter sp. 15-1451]